MPKRLLPLTIAAPGFFGLNTMQRGSILPPGWATKLENFVYDDVGRIASRKGSRQLNGTVVTSSPTIKAVHEYIDGSGNTVNIFAADNKIWKEVSGTMTDVSGTITTPTADNWQFANFNDWCVGFQESHAPIVATSATTPVFADSGGTQYEGSMVLSAYGRIWTVVDSVLYYSDLLINNFTGGSAGNFDLAKFWPGGMDEAVALADFNGLLVVFGKRSIILYENPDDVTNMALVESIKGIGCVARDSVQNIGEDVVYLSNTGLRSLARTVIQESLPITDISKHVRDEVISSFNTETPVEVKSVYNENDGFYLISMPTTGKSYYFDLKFPNEDGSWKAATWDIAPTAMMYSQDKTMYMAITDGYLSQYLGYVSEADSSGANGSAYTVDYESAWNDLGEEVSNYLKIPKQVSVLAGGSSGGTVFFKWALGYSSTFKQVALEFRNTAPSQFNVAKYGTDVYGASGEFERIKKNLSGTGQVMKVGLFAPIEDSEFAVQRLDVLSKIGRLGL